MYLRTEIEKRPKKEIFNIESKVITIGSCFSDVLGNYLINNKLECFSNPFGTVFNLQSISNLLLKSIQKTNFNDASFLESHQIFYNYHLHSSFCANSKTELESQIQIKQIELNNFLINADFLIITLGTSWIYRNINSKEIVSNCHKQPATLFTKELLSIEIQKTIFEHLHQQLLQFNPKLQIILTVSPVRHIKDTIELNSISKAILRILCQIASELDNVTYFPSYEIMMDDLRDYRFYKADLIHPNEVAEKYIIDIFSENYFDKNLQYFIKEWSKLKLAMQHRPFNSDTLQHQKFLKNIYNKLLSISNEVCVQQEIEFIRNQLKEIEL